MNTQLIHDNYSINQKGNFCIGSYDAVDLAKEFGTPLYVLDEQKVRSMCRKYTDCAQKYFKDAKILYASKALSFKGIYKICQDEGLYTDTVSAGEIFTALSAGFPSQNIFFHGNNKTPFDIEYAIKNNVGFFVADNKRELDIIEQICLAQNKTAKVLLRITPGIDLHTNEKIATGNVDSKFGSSIETGQALDFTKYALSKTNIELCGFHCHVGSQSFEPQPFLDSCDIMFEFINTVRKECSFVTKMLNLGGGFGVRYTPEQQNLDIDYMMRKISQHVNLNCDKYNLVCPQILFEPGRSIVAAAGVTLYTVGNIKTIPGYKNYISVDGGMADNPRYALYQAPYYCLIANKASENMDFVADIAGRCCESGDIIQPSVTIQKAVPEDILCVCVTGAYNYSMASNYNRLLKPALVTVGKDGAKLAVRRETFEDLIKCDI